MKAKMFINRENKPPIRILSMVCKDGKIYCKDYATKFLFELQENDAVSFSVESDKFLSPDKYLGF